MKLYRDRNKIVVMTKLLPLHFYRKLTLPSHVCHNNDLSKPVSDSVYCEDRSDNKVHVLESFTI